MYRLKLVVADSDEEYLGKLCVFLNDEHRKDVRVVSFTTVESLQEYLMSGEKVDLLLINPDFICDDVNNLNVGVSVLLSANGQYKSGQYPSVIKYQNGDNLLGQLMDLYLDRNREAGLYTEGDDCRIVTVYSPCGGVGKSTVAVNLAVQTSLMGNSVFYLNLEPFNCSQKIFTGRGDGCLSNLLLHVQNKDLLPAKIKSFSVRDLKYNVNFFLPPESAAELSELDRDSTVNLLQGLRRAGAFDLVIIDTDPAFSPKNLAILEISDVVVLLSVQDEICGYKLGVMQEELEKMSLNPDRKIIKVINKYSGEKNFFGENSADCKLPLVEDMVLKNERTGCMEFNSLYAGYILNLSRLVMGP